MKRIEFFTAALTAAFLVSSALAPLSRAGFQEGVEAYEAKDYMTAFEEWLPLAKKNDPAAMRNIGHMYRRGLGVPQDFDKAMTWYKRAATIGFDRAQANVAGMYLAGEGVEQNYAQAANWFARAAQQGHVISQYNLALLLENGLGVRKDERMALGWFELAAKAGHPGAAKRAAELTTEFKTRDPITADMSSQPAVTTTADAAETDVSTQSAAEGARTATETTATADEPAAPAKTEASEASETAAPATPAQSESVAAAPAVDTTAASSGKGVQKKGFYEALRSLVTKDTPKQSGPEPAAPAEPAPTVATAMPKDKATTDAIEPATSGAVTRAEEPPTPAVKPAPEPADKPAVAEAPQESVTVASNPAPAAAESAPAPAAPAKVAPGSGLSLSEKMEMADLAYSLQQYQQSLGIWAPLAAEGNAMAQYRMGVLFNNGQGVPVDRVRAYYWWDKARSNGSAAAASAIGTLEQTLTHLEKRQIDRVN